MNSLSLASTEVKGLKRYRSSGVELTTMGVGGPVNEVCEVDSIVSLQMLIREFVEQGTKFRVLGAGSNVVIPDAGIRQPIIRLARSFSGLFDVHSFADLPLRTPEPAWFSLDADRTHVFSLAGGSLMRVSRELSNRGLSGLEFAAGIPATIGGAVAMNAGAHGSEIGDVLVAVALVTPDGACVVLPAKSLELSYRSCELPRGSVIVGALFSLAKREPSACVEERKRCLGYRKETQPLTLPSAGSVFTNPDSERGVFAGALLERVGLKGKEYGGIAYSELHANWLVKVADSASAEAVATLVRLGREQVKIECGEELHAEIQLW